MDSSLPIPLDLFPGEDQRSDSAPPPPQEPPPEKPYHAKRPHKKSRLGCKNCKARKVKCDEARPSCRSCVLRQVECVYPKPPPSAASPSQAHQTISTPASASGTSATFDFASSQTTSAAASPSSALVNWQQQQPRGATPSDSDAGSMVTREPLFTPSHLDMNDMRLLWFYTTTTSASFSVDTGSHNPVNEILKVHLVRVAFECPFLMDTVFALSSLHLLNLDQECDASRALAYRVRSFEGYRRAVEEAKPETFPALIANSLFLTALSSQVFRDTDGKDLYIIDWLIVWRGIGLIVEMMGMDTVLDSGMSALFWRPPIDLDDAAATIPNYLLFMLSSIKPGDIDYPDVQVYYDTLKYLGSLYDNLRKGLGPVMNLRIITWFTFIPRDFVQLARERRPRALVIIAHYAAFVKIVQDVWWLTGVGDRTLRDIINFLGPAWENLLRVPERARHVQGELAVARVILEDDMWMPPLAAITWVDSPAPNVTLVDNDGRRVRWDSGEQRFQPLNENILDPSLVNDSLVDETLGLNMSEN